MTSPGSNSQTLSPWGQILLVTLPRIAAKMPKETTPSEMRYFTAPELHRCEQLPGQRPSCFDPAADLWALGVLVFLLLSGQYPQVSARPGETPSDEVLQRGQCSFEPRDVWAQISPGAKEFLKDGLLQANPKMRATAGEALSHAWIATFAGGRDVPLSRGFRISGT